MRIIIAGIAGLIFGFGLLMSQMVNPAVVRGFLDIFGVWDPRLMFVLGGAVLTSIVAWRIRERMAQPFFGGGFPAMASLVIDRKLILGAVLFGIGWGLVGICPGPAIAAVLIGGKGIIYFIGFSALGMWLSSKVA